MPIGLPRQLIVNVTMNTQSCVNHFVTFASSDETVATVNERGLVTPIAPGIAQITATPTNGQASPAVCTVTIADEATIIRLPANLTRVKSGAFAGLTGQILIVIPTSADVHIAPDAFAGSGITISQASCLTNMRKSDIVHHTNITQKQRDTVREIAGLFERVGL